MQCREYKVQGTKKMAVVKFIIKKMITPIHVKTMRPLRFVYTHFETFYKCPCGNMVEYTNNFYYEAQIAIKSICY